MGPGGKEEKITQLLYTLLYIYHKIEFLLGINYECIERGEHLYIKSLKFIRYGKQQL